MRNMICTLALALLLTQVGCAQEPHRSYGQPSIDQLATQLNLTPTQKTQVQQILNDSNAERQQLLNSGEDRRQVMQQVRSDLITKMSAVLTPDQLQQFEQMEQQHRHHGHGGFGGYGQQQSPGE
jgi:Spy/CpxP family protein refolding chaperone